MMKKYLLLLMLILSLALSACGVAPEAPGTAPAAVPTEIAAPTPVEVDITMDNWQDYFELRESEQVRVNDRGEVLLREFGYGVFLKEEFRDRLPENGAADVSFEMKAKSVRKQVMGDLNTDNFIIRGSVLHDEGEVLLTQAVEDWRGSSKMEAGSDFDNAVAAFFTVDGEFAG